MPDKRIYNFQIPRTTPTNGLKKWLFHGLCEVRKGPPLWKWSKIDQLFIFLAKWWIFLEPKVLHPLPHSKWGIVKKNWSVYISPVLKSSKLEFDNYQSIFVWHFASQSILTTGVLAKYRSFLWNWTPSHIQRIYKGQNSENPLRAITFDWCVLQTWDQRLWAAFLMLFSGIPHLPTFCHVACVTYVTSRVSRASRISRVKCRVR